MHTCAARFEAALIKLGNLGKIMENMRCVNIYHAEWLP